MPEKRNLNKFQDGAFNWMLVIFLSLSLNLILENYLSYGIIKYPTEIITIFIEFVQSTWIFHSVIILSFLLQIILCLAIEKRLARGQLSEKLGISLHYFNSLLVFNVIAVIYTKFIYCPVAAYWLSETFFVSVFKFLSYIIENQKHRIKVRFKKEDTQDLQDYPNNVTLKNLSYFILCSTSILYKIDGLKSKSKNFAMAVITIIEIMAIHFIIAFLYYQYINPGVRDLAHSYEHGYYLRALQGSVKLILPVIFGWYLTFYVYIFQCFLVLVENLFGTQKLTSHEDWWNAENAGIFWKKWNVECHIILKDLAYVPAIQKGYSPHTASLFVGAVSGIMHEYLLTIPLRSYYGYAVIAIMSQTFATDITIIIQKYVGEKYSNFIIALAITIGYTIYIISACNSSYRFID